MTVKCKREDAVHAIYANNSMVLDRTEVVVAVKRESAMSLSICRANHSS
jgi:hypothetical protein